MPIGVEFEKFRAVSYKIPIYDTDEKCSGAVATFLGESREPRVGLGRTTACVPARARGSAAQLVWCPLEAVSHAFRAVSHKMFRHRCRT